MGRENALPFNFKLHLDDHEPPVQVCDPFTELTEKPKPAAGVRYKFLTGLKV